ncbi:MAG: response regulator [Syntrophomonadaceae bacterium]|nr:response regulator [Syntrophomonadaceae bacterium]
MNILLVDDEKYQLETIKRGVKIHGHQVITAESAEEALEYLRQRPGEVHLVITDYLMNGMNGLNLLKEIRRSFGSLPVIIMTAYGDQNLVVEAMRNRCDDYIDKPFKPRDLMEQVEKIERKMGQVIPFPGSYLPDGEEAEAGEAALAGSPAMQPAAGEVPAGDPLRQIGMGWTVPLVRVVFPALLFIGLGAVMFFQFVLPFIR